MARPLRIEMENGLYHVTVRGWERRAIVDGEEDREDWLRLLDRVATRSSWRVFAWVLMSNHFHLFLRTLQPNLSAGMHDLNAGYASLFNRRHCRVGSLFQGRFKAILVENESHAWELSRYIHLNPVRSSVFEEVQRHHNDARAAAIYLARHLTDQTVSAIAEQFGGVSLAAISKTVKRAESRRIDDKPWDRLLDKLEKQCSSKPTVAAKS